MLVSERELEVRKTSGVSDCYIQLKKNQAGQTQSILFFVPLDTFSAEDVETAIIQALGDSNPFDFVVPVTRLPRNQNGHIDVIELDKLTIFDQSFLTQNLCERLGENESERMLAIMTSNSFTSPTLYLDELAQFHIAQMKTSVSANKQDSASLNAKQSPAFSDGGDLNIPNDAPRVLTDCLLRSASASQPASVLSLNNQQQTQYNYAQLLHQSSCVLAGLRATGMVVGTPVIFQFRDNAQFLVGFWGCLLGGFVPVPMATAADYQADEASIENIQRVSGMLDDAPILTSADMLDEISGMPWPNDQPSLRTLNLAALLEYGENNDYHLAQPDDVTLIMLTSGTTGAPKGVPLTHKNLICRSIASVQVNQFNQQTISLNWMPLDHVAGIIYFHLRDVYLGCKQIHVAASDILESPLVWLDLLDKYQVSVTFAPNFAFGLIAGLREEIAQRKWDLSKLKLVLNGGEAVVSATARQFLKMLGPFGLSKHAMCPAWGMSETSSGITYARDFELHNTSDSDSHVSVGPPIPGDFMRITDAENQIISEGEIGRLQVKGNTVFNGYYNNPEENQEAFTEDGWFNTGDLGKLVKGKLTITGREKDVIIVNGVNYSGPGIESIVEDIPQVTRSYAAACAVSDPRHNGKECLAIFFVCDSQSPSADLLRTIKGQVTSKAGVSPEYLIPLHASDIPKTSIGKIQRTKLKIAFESGQFLEHIKRADILLGNHCIPAWFFQRTWQCCQPEPVTSLHGQNIVVIADDAQISAGIIDMLASVKANPILVLQCDGIDLSDAKSLTIRPQFSDDYTQLFKMLLSTHEGVDQIILLGPSTTECQHSYLADCDVIACAKGLSKVEGFQSGNLLIITDRAQALDAEQIIQTQHASLPAVVKTLKQEISQLSYDLIDLDFNDLLCFQNLCTELALPGKNKDVLWRNGQRYQSVLQAFLPNPVAKDPLQSDEAASFVISGGMGGIGQILTKILLRSDQVHVLLVGSRSKEVIEQQGGQLASLLATYRQLAYVSVDVADQHELSKVVNAWLQRTGAALKGIFHLASQYHESPLIDETPAQFERVSHAKVSGAKSFIQIANAHKGAYLVNFSSTAGVFGGALIGAYAAASCKLDAMSHNARANGIKCFNINWSSWQSTGMSEGNAAIDALRTRGILELEVGAALTSLRLVLGQPVSSQVVVGLDPANLVIRQACEQALNLHVPSVFIAENTNQEPDLPQYYDKDSLEFSDSFGNKHDARIYTVETLPRLKNGEVDRSALDVIVAHGNVKVLLPKTPLETQLVQIWKLILRMDTISIDWNFFDVGGQSILATKLIAAIRQAFSIEWTLKDIFSAPTCQQQAAAIEQQLKQTEGDIPTPRINHSIPILSRNAPLPLSSAQKRLWFIEQLDIPSSAYNVTACIRFSSTPSLSKVTQCLNLIVAQQESLRVIFPSIDGVPKQVVQQDVQIQVEVLKADNTQSVETLLIEHGKSQFDLSTGPLICAALIFDSAGEATLALTLHHIISDGWSMRVLFEHFETAYLGDEIVPPHPSKVQYADYSAFQQMRIEKGNYGNQLAFWRNQLESGLAGFDLPTDFPRPLVQTYEGRRHIQTIPAILVGQLKEQAIAANVTPFVMLLSLFQILLSRYTQKDDVIIGTVVANRDYAEVKDLIGFFVNPVIIRSKVDNTISFDGLRQQVNQTVLDAVANHNMPFEYLVDKLVPPRDTSRSPLFQIAFDLRDPNLTHSQSNELAFSVMEADLGTAKYDLHLTLEERGAEIIAFWEYNTDLFAAQTISNMAQNYQRLMESVLESPHTSIASLELLSAVEVNNQERWNQSNSAFRNDLCMHQLFELTAESHPNRDAIVFEQDTISYHSLNAKANQLARLLVNKGATPDSLIALCLDRSIDAIVSVLAVLKSGAAYLALDPTYPQKRLEFMLADAGASLMISQNKYADLLATTHCDVLVFEQLTTEIEKTASDNLNIAVAPHNLAYAIYTSGSTGTPKGVLLEHKGWCNVAQAQIDSFDLQSGMRVLQFASMSFDASAFELAMAWGSGGTLIMGSKEQILPGPGLANLLATNRVQVVTLPPTALTALPDVQLPDLQVITVAGEACPQSLVNKWSGDGKRFYNLYGPTETTIWASYAQCYAKDNGTPVIGKPVANTQLYVVDELLNLLPAGMPGELCIAGVGVARGYHGRADLNAQKFLPNPFSSEPGSRLYRSGDLVRFRNDGALEFLGRIDHQVKVRGFRIELGEIEALIRKYQAVSETVVVAHSDDAGETQLLAYVSSASLTSADALSIRDFLKASLTDYMIPAHIFILESLPLSLNGKVDRKALPSPQSLLSAKPESLQTADSDMEQIVSGIWKNVLALESIDVNQNFFDIGGHSLKMAQVQTQLQQALKRDISLVDLFQHTSIKALAAYLEIKTDPQGDALQKGADEQQKAKMQSKVSGKDRMAKMAAMKRRQGR